MHKTTAPLLALLALLGLAGCAHGRPSPQSATGRDPALAKPAEPLPSTSAAVPGDNATAVATSTDPEAASRGGTDVAGGAATSVPATSAGGSGSRPTTAEPSGTGTAITPTNATVADPRGDVDTLAPAYADIVSVTAESTTSLRVTVALAGAAPRVLGSGEVIGLGIDIFRSGAKESDYQLFADAGSNGWVAYLETPKGFVKYPGSFEQGDTRVVFDVPWESLGGRTAIRFSTFLDWSKQGVAVNPSSSDAAPDAGQADLAA